MWDLFCHLLQLVGSALGPRLPLGIGLPGLFGQVPASLGLGSIVIGPPFVFEGAGSALVLQAATVETAFQTWAIPTGVVWEGTAGTGLAVAPGWLHALLTL